MIPMLRHTATSFWIALALCSAACSDDSGGADGPGAADALAGPTDSRPTGPTPDAGPHSDDARATPIPGGRDAGNSIDPGGPDAAPPPPDCDDDPTCGPGRVCHRGRCIEGTRCDMPDGCGPGRICVSNICLIDTSSTGGLIAEPDALLFTFAVPGAVTTRTTVLQNEGEDAIELVAFDVTGAHNFVISDAPDTPFRLAPGRQTPITIEHTADDNSTETGLLRITTDRAAAMPIEVQLASQRKEVGGARPCLQVVPNRLNFGSVARGGSATRTFELIGCGSQSVSVDTVRRGLDFFGELPPTFQLDPPPALPAPLAQGERLEVSVTYSPRRAGFEAGFWEVVSNDEQNPIQRVDVSAVATPPPLADIGLHIRLEWDTDLTDVDMHVLAPNGVLWSCESDCYFANGQPNWGDPNRFEDDPFLDVDDVDGFGPENINIEDPAPGTYRVLIQYWDAHEGDPPTSTVTVLTFGQPVATYGPQRMTDPDEVWEVVDIEWPGLGMQPLGGVSVQPRGNNLCGF